jgi:hypothetical protein
MLGYQLVITPQHYSFAHPRFNPRIDSKESVPELKFMDR